MNREGSQRSTRESYSKKRSSFSICVAMTLRDIQLCGTENGLSAVENTDGGSKAGEIRASRSAARVT